MLGNSKIGFVIEQPIEHKRGITDADVDHLGVERRVLIGEMRIEKTSRFRAVFGVNVTCAVGFPAGTEALAVG